MSREDGGAKAGGSARVAFWVTAGGRHGGGHLSRCMALARRLPPDCDVVLVVPDNEYTRALGIAGGSTLVTHAEVHGWAPRLLRSTLLERGWSDGPDLLVIDGRWAPEEHLAAELRTQWPGVRIAMMGGPEEQRLAVDLHVIPDAGFRPPGRGDESRPRVVGGSRYVILGQRGSPEPWSPPGEPATVLVTAGSADPFNASGLFLDALEQCRAALRGIVVLGGGFLHAGEIRRRVRDSSAELEIAEQVHDLRPLMERSDLALCAYGVTCLELAQMGVPTVTVTHTAPDVAYAKRLARLGFLEVAGWVDTADAGAIARTVDRLLGAPEKLRSMSESGRNRIDGMGAERVAAELCALLG